jgi:hypothetical protein
MQHTSSIYKIIVITTDKNRKCTSVTKFIGAVTTIYTVTAIQPQPKCQAVITHRLVQLRSDQHAVVPLRTLG